jgi:CheY-like chemotaxis protein
MLADPVSKAHHGEASMHNTVLIAEDNAAVRGMLIKLVRHAAPDANIVDVASGKGALELWARYHPDLVMLDHGLPDISGFQVLHRIKMQDASPYVIVITGDARLQQEAIAYGADEVWLKPMDIPAALSHLRGLLD